MTKDEWLQIRISKKEKESIKKLAKKMGMSVSVYIRFILLNNNE